MMKFLKENLGGLLTILFLVIVGILLLVNPEAVAIGVIKVAGILLLMLGLLDIIRYFRTNPKDAAKGDKLYSGLLNLLIGSFCVFASGWFVTAFPVLAVLYGILQVLLGLRNVQKAVDGLRLHVPLWYLKAISAAISLLFGLIIIANPTMTIMSIWVFTGLTMIIEGLFDCAAMILTVRQTKAKETASGE